MKTNYWLVLVLSLAFNAMAVDPVFVLSNDDDVVGQKGASQIGSQTAFRDLSQHIPLLGQDAIIIASLPATNSPNLNQSRVNTMAGLFSIDVPSDRNMDPAAWYWVPNQTMAPLCWQWFDMVSTPTFHSWKGSSTVLNQQNAGEYGHRMVIHVTGSYPVSAYTVTISSSITNLAPITFGIHTNSGGGEIAFNPQFIGHNPGPNGTNESSYSTAQGKLVQVGDDSVFDAGQLPSGTNYTNFARYGSSFVIYADGPAAMESVRAQFTSPQWFKAELRKNGVLVAMSYVQSLAPVASATKSPDQNQIQISLTGGVENTPYSLESRTNLTSGTWQVFLPGEFFTSGTTKTFPNDWIHERFLRAVPR